MDKLPKSLTTVTTLSKTVAMMLFVALPFVGFYFGMRSIEKIAKIKYGKNDG